MHQHRKALIVLPLLLALAACNSWERQVFQTLSASKATVDQAAADYQAKKIPNTGEAFNAITKARRVQIAAVDAFHGYALAKVQYQNSKLPGDKAALDIAVNGVNAALVGLPDALAAIRNLRGGQ